MSRFSYFIIAILIAIAAWMRSELLLLIGFILALVALVSYWWTRYSLEAVTYQRQFGARRLYQGEETELQVQITNAKPLPLPWLRVDDDVPPGIRLNAKTLTEKVRGKQQLVNVLGMRWYERVTRRYRLMGQQRGAWKFGPARIRSGDIFGFNITFRNDETIDELLVYPLVVPIGKLNLPIRHPLGETRTPRRVIDDPLRLVTVRDYTQGDNFRHIHWKASARRQSLQTKVFEPSASQPVVFVLNINTATSPAYGFEPDLREFGICAAASLASHLWQEGRAIGLISNAADLGSARYLRVSPRYSPEQLSLVLTALARIDDSWGRWNVENLLEVEAAKLPQSATIVVITPVVTRNLRQHLIDLRRREFGIVLLTLGGAKVRETIPNIHTHHLGGQEQWHDILYTRGIPRRNQLAADDDSDREGDREGERQLVERLELA